MKRSILLILSSMLILTACGSSSKSGSQNVEVKDNRTENASGDATGGTSIVDNRDKNDSDAAATASDDEFEKTGYLFENTIGDTLYFYIVKNNSNAAVRIDGNATAMDSNNNPIGANERSIDVLGPGETSLMVFYFDGVTGIDKVDCSLSYNTNPRYKPVIGNLSLEQTINDQNLTLVATNNGSVNAQFVEAYALFFDDSGNVVSYDSQYVVDGDSEIKPGSTISVQLDTYKGFDHVECYITGRSDGEASEKTADISDNDFSVKEYSYENSIGDSIYFLVIKNNSDKTVGINGNMTAYDAGGNVIGADSSDIDVIGPGEESIADFFFDSVSNIDHVEYTFSYDTSPYYGSVLSDLGIEGNINDSNVVVSVTNNGTEPAQFVQAYALFLDSDGKVVSYESSYVVDGDSEIKPGATISKQLDTRDDFNTVEVYFTGRKGGL